jgi:hypothetical protein
MLMSAKFSNQGRANLQTGRNLARQLWMRARRWCRPGISEVDQTWHLQVKGFDAMNHRSTPRIERHCVAIAGVIYNESRDKKRSFASQKS